MQFKSHGPCAETYVWLPFCGLLLAAALALLLIDPSVETAAAALVPGGMGTWFASSAIYGAWGTVEIERAGSDWIVCYRLLRWKSCVRFAVANTRATERCVQNSQGFGSRAGPHLLVHVAGRRQPIRIGGGFHLDDAELRTIENLLAPGVNFR